MKKRAQMETLINQLDLLRVVDTTSGSEGHRMVKLHLLLFHFILI